MNNQNISGNLDQIEMGKIPTSSDSFNKSRGKSGLTNTGNTCYMNSAIQTISHTYHLRTYLFDNEKTIIEILLTNANKILSAIKPMCSELTLNIIKQKINLKNYTPTMLTNDERIIILNNTMTYQVLRLLKEGLWGSKNKVSEEITSTTSRTKEKFTHEVIPISFKRIFAEVRDTFFHGNDQHDAEEAYSCIIQKMQEELGQELRIIFKTKRTSVGDLLNFKKNIQDKINLVTDPEEKQHLINLYLEKKKSMPEESLILDAYTHMKKYYGSSHSRLAELYTGFYHMTIKCPNENCNYASNKFEPFSLINFELANKTSNLSLDNCMETFCKEEILDKDNLWKCDSCKQMVQAKKQSLLWSNPAILVIQLKRFGIDRMRKDTRFVDFPLKNLDIYGMMSPVNADSKKKYYTYDLYSVINHAGGIHGGHYYSYCLDEESGNWYKYDDSNVEKISTDKIINNNAYILFYLRKNYIKNL